MRRVAAALGAALALALPAAAQEASLGEVVAPLLTLDQDRLFAESAWGKRVQAEIEAASRALAAENRRIEAQLTAEEKSLTERRPTMTPEAFRAEADAFDARVVNIRSEQDGKSRDLLKLRETELQAFFAAALPILGEVMRERGAVAIFDARSVLVSAAGIDITADVISAIDARVGPGPTRQDAAPPDSGD